MLDAADDPDAPVVRDSLYSRIPLDRRMLPLLATPEFLRLQRIKQLGWVYTIWPGATHTRYEHSLGVYHLMQRALAGLGSRPHGGLAGAPPSELRAVLAAALLHDLGHYPFSHGIEELGPPVAPHEQVGARLIRSERIARLLEHWGADPEDVVWLIQPGRTERGGRWPVYRALLSGALDVDKMDYLPRDARACNVPYGGVDVERLLASLRVQEGPDEPQLMVSEKGISPLHSLIRARQEMFDNVYWHHTNRACMAMLLRAVQDAVDADAVDSAALTGHDDGSLLALLADRRMPPTTRALVGALSARRIHKRSVEFATRSGEVFRRLDSLFYQPALRKRLELTLCDAVAAATGLHIAQHELLLDIPKPERWEVSVPVLFERPPVGLQPVMSWTEATGMQPHDMAAYESHQRRIRLVTTERLRDRAWELRETLIIPTLLRGVS